MTYHSWAQHATVLCSDYVHELDANFKTTCIYFSLSSELSSRKGLSFISTAVYMYMYTLEFTAFYISQMFLSCNFFNDNFELKYNFYGELYEYAILYSH